MRKWYKEIITYRDLIDFEKHLKNVEKHYGPMENRYYPSEIKVSGKAYFPIKTKILLEERRERNVLWGGINALLGGNLPLSIARQVWSYVDEYNTNKKSSELKAATKVVVHYNNIIKDNGSKMTIEYTYFHAIDTLPNPPNLY